MSAQSNNVLLPLTGLRFLAAALVVVFHFWHPINPVLKNFVDHGAFGVTIFFVLSGFILSYSYSLGPGLMRGDLRSFWAARFARLYPTYLLGMVLIAPIVLLSADEPAWQRIASAALSVVGAQAWFHTLGLSWGVWNPPGWSLSAEAFFYLAFPLTCIAMSKLTPRQLMACALGSWGLSVLAVFMHFVVNFAEGDFWGFVPVMRFPEFLLGMATGLMWKNRRTSVFDAYAPVIVVSSALVMVAMMCLPLHVKWYFSGVLAPLAALLICALACGKGRLAAILSWRPVVVLGGASYSLYILHWPLWSIGKYFFGETKMAMLQPNIYFVAYFTFTILASCICFKYFEEPLNHLLRQKLMGRPALTYVETTAVQQSAGPGAMTLG